MGESCVCLQNLTPTMALAKLAAAANQDGIDLKSLLTVWIRPAVTQAGNVRVSLVIPHGQGKRRQPQQALVKALNEAYGTVGTPVDGPRRDDDMNFLAGCAWLLVNTAGTGKPAHVDDSRFLIAGRGLTADRAHAVMLQLRVEATGPIHVAVERGPDDELVYLYAVRSDAERGGFVRSGIEGGQFEGCQALVAYLESEDWFYLPDRSALAPSAEALTSFGALIGKLAPLLRPDGGDAAGRFGIAIFPDTTDPESPQYALLVLAKAQFEDDLLLVPGLARNMTFQVYDLAASREALGTLASKIRAADPPIGYELRLISSPEYDQAEMTAAQRAELLRSEQQRLLEALTDVQYDLQNQEALLERRPILLRFTPAQLPAMADVLRSFPMGVLREGHISYGFQATRRYPAGMHFLLTWPDRATMNQLDPRMRWEQPDCPMRFWLDPQWARYYYSAGNRNLVFVPQYRVLFPPVHAWERADMDRRWEDAMRLFLEESEAGEVPDYPQRIYVCEDAPRSVGYASAIDVTVLNAAVFVPLQMRLGWLNDHLLVLNQVGVERYIEVMADSMLQEELAHAVMHRAADAREAFNRSAAATSRDLQAILSQLLSDVATEMSAQVAAMRRTVDETRRQIQADIQAVKKTEDDTSLTHDEMKRLQARLKALQQTHAAIKRRDAHVTRLEQQTSAEAGKVEAAVRQLKARVDDAERQRQSIERDVSAEIQLLQRTRETLQLQLNELDRGQR